MSKYAIWLALGATLIAVYWVSGDEEQAISQPTRSTAVPALAGSSGTASNGAAGTSGSAGSAVATQAGTPDLRIRPRDGNEDWGNLFGAPPPPVVAAAPQKQPKTKLKPQPALPPQAPPLPFQYLGRFVDGTRIAYFLQWNERNLVLRPGDTVDQVWKLEQAHGGLLTFTYLPLNQKQSMAVGDVN